MSAPSIPVSTEPRLPSRILALLALATIACLSLSACGGGGDDESETLAWVRIDAPLDGYATGADTVLVKGNAAMRDGSYPDTIYWHSNYGSGTAIQSVTCIMACIAAFQAEVPLGLGENTISVTMVDGSDQVTVSRYNQVVVSGRITVDNPEGPSAADLPVTLSGSTDTLTTSSDEFGTFQFINVTTDDYTLAPTQPAPPQSDSCFTFSPADRAVTVPANDLSDIVNQDFVANTLLPCFHIEGTVTLASDPSISIANVKMTLTDSDGHTLVRYTGTNGHYIFRNLAPGDYYITPDDCTVESCVGYTPGYLDITITNTGASSQDFFRE